MSLEWLLHVICIYKSVKYDLSVTYGPFRSAKLDPEDRNHIKQCDFEDPMLQHSTGFLLLLADLGILFHSPTTKKMAFKDWGLKVSSKNSTALSKDRVKLVYLAGIGEYRIPRKNIFAPTPEVPLKANKKKLILGPKNGAEKAPKHFSTQTITWLGGNRHQKFTKTRSPDEDLQNQKKLGHILLGCPWYLVNGL